MKPIIENWTWLLPILVAFVIASYYQWSHAINKPQELAKARFDVLSFKLRMRCSQYFAVMCNQCYWVGSSEHTAGGRPIADTGDYSELRCPDCNSPDLLED